MRVLILGAGPAGSATAITLRQHGVEVIMLEPFLFSRDPPGETLHPGVEPLLDRLGALSTVLDAAYLRHEGHWVTWNSAPRFVPFGSDSDGSWRGFQAPRIDFDARLRAVAIHKGVVLSHARPLDTLHNLQGRLIGIMTCEGPIWADWVIDCSGSAQWLSRKMGIQYQLFSPPLVARYGYAHGILLNNLPCIEADRNGWTWIAEVASQRFQWTRVTQRSRRESRIWTPPLLAGLRHDPVRGADVTWRIANHTTGPGWLLTGDAAAVLDPSSSHGVLRAIMSGMMAAHVIVSSSVSFYHEWLTSWFNHDVMHMRSAYHEIQMFD